MFPYRAMAARGHADRILTMLVLRVALVFLTASVVLSVPLSGGKAP